MERQDAIHVAVGSALLGIGGVALAIVIPLAAAAQTHPWTAGWFLAPSMVAGLLGLAGLYTLIAVYTGWPLPTTASERRRKPKLRLKDVYLIEPEEWSEWDYVFAVEIENEGGGNITRAAVNVLMPDAGATVTRCDYSGAPLADGLAEKGSFAKSPEEVQPGDASIYWSGFVDFPARVARLFAFRVKSVGPGFGLTEDDEFPLRVSVISTALDTDFSRRAAVDLSALHLDHA